jgi:hypothetical protein
MMRPSVGQEFHMWSGVKSGRQQKRAIILASGERAREAHN